jgi:hypothetical protein
MIASLSKNSIINRMLGAALLEPEPYQEAALTPSIKTQALLVVIVSSIAMGLGSLGAGPMGFVLGTIAGLAGWGVYVFAAYRTATARFQVPRSATIWGSTWRVLALASTPRLFLVFTLVPGIGFLVGLAVHAWLLLTTVSALRPALDLDTRPTIIVALSGWLPMLLLWALLWLLI